MISRFLNPSMKVGTDGSSVLVLEESLDCSDFDLAIEHICLLLQARVIDKVSATACVIDYCSVPYCIRYEQSASTLLMTPQYEIDACSLSDIHELLLLRVERVSG